MGGRNDRTGPSEASGQLRAARGRAVAAFKFAGLAMLLGIWAVSANAQAPEMTRVGHMGGVLSALATAGHFLYAGQGPELRVFDITDAANPVSRGHVYLGGFVEGVVLANNLAYVTTWASSTGGLWIVDVSNPDAPCLLSKRDIYFGKDIAVSGNFVYVAAYVEGLQVFDVSNPAAPTQIASFALPNEGTHGVDIQGNYAYVTYGDGKFRVFDITNPAQLTVVGTTQILTAGGAEQVRVTGHYAYVAATAAGVQLIDVSDPTNPTLASDLLGDLWGACGVRIAGDLLFVTSDYYYGFRMFDISNPLIPVPLWSYYMHGGFDMCVSGNHVFATGQRYERGYLYVFDVADPAIPGLAGTYISAAPNAIAISGNLAVLADTKTLAIADISNPLDSTVLSRLPVNGEMTYGDVKVFQRGSSSYACVLAYDTEIVDITNPSAPTLVSRIGVGGRTLFVSGMYAYVAEYGLHILDISDVAHPLEVGFFNTPYVVQVCVQGKYAYLADYVGGFHIVDVENPALPVEVGAYIGKTVMGVDVSGNYAYLATSNGLEVLDVSVPSAPVQKSAMLQGNYASFVTVVGSYALVSLDYSFHVVDIGDPSAPEEVATYPLGGRGAVHNDYVYLASAAHGLFALAFPFNFDTEPPVITCPPNVTAGCSTERLVSVTWPEPVVTDNRPGATVVCVPASGSGFAIGTTVVTCTATDAAGNTASCSFTVTRASMGFTGFMSPIGGADDTSGGSFDAPVRAFKLGSTIPVKFAATSCGGPVLTGVHTLKAIKYSSSTTSDPAIDATPTDGATAGNQFRLTDGQWHFNLSTKSLSQGTWKLVATLSDGSEHFVWITIKK